MKKIIAILLAVFLLAMPVLAGWEEEANIGNVKYTIGEVPSKPVLGEFDTSKYTKLDVKPGDMSYAWNDNFDDAEAWAKGQTFEAYVAYDSKTVYTLIIADAKHYQCDIDDGDGNVWQHSCIQVSVAGEKDEGGDRLEYGIFRNSKNGNLGSVIWSQHGGAKSEFEAVAGTSYTVALKDGKLYYETFIPVSAFLNKDSVAKGDIIAWNIVIAQTDPDESGHIHTQIASGCTGNGKTAENFARLTLGDKIVVAAPVEEVAPPAEAPAPEAAAPVAEAAPAPAPAPAPVVTAPKIGDTGVIIFITIMAAAGVVVFKRKAVR